MGWLKLDDQITHHVKFLRAGSSASWLWVCCLAHCQRQLTDGFIPREVCHLLGAPEWERDIDCLIEVELVHAVAGGYQLHDYLDYNSSRADVLARRTQDAVRKGLWDSKRIPTLESESTRRRNPKAPDAGIQKHPTLESESTRRASRAGTRTRDAPASPPLPSVPVPSVPAPSARAEAPAARARGRTDEKTGHRQHVFCGSRFCVPQFLAEEHRQQLGHLAASVDLAAQYLAWDRELGDEPVRSPKAYLASQVAGLIRRVGPVPRGAAPTSPDVWSDVMDVLTDRLTRYELSTWFAGTRLLVASSNRLVVAIDNQAKADWIHRHYADQLAAAIAAVRPGADVVFQAERTET